VFEHYDHLVLPLVQGVDMHHSNSFPSGHASTFFMFCTCVAIYLAYRYSRKNRPRNLRTQILVYAVLLLLVVLAALGAYSRVYLSQHFLSDVCVGSIIGFITPFLMLYLFRDRILKPKKEEIK
jgi:membrane-associated phospholipid phosphatase